MRRLALTLTIAWQGACAALGQAPDGQPVLTYRGATVTSQAPLDANEMAFVLDVAADEASYPGDYAGLEILFQEPVPEVYGDPVGAYTDTPGRYMRLYYPARTGCLNTTHIAHELAHWLAYLQTGDGDPGHINPRYFGRDGLAAAVYSLDTWYCDTTPDLQNWARRRVRP